MEIEIKIKISKDQLKEISKYITVNGDPPSQDRLENEYMSVKNVAEMLQISEQTVINHIKLGLLKAAKQGKRWMISRSSIKKYANGE